MILLKQKLLKHPLEHKLESLGKFLGFIALIVAALIVSIGLILEYVDGGDLWKKPNSSSWLRLQSSLL